MKYQDRTRLARVLSMPALLLALMPVNSLLGQDCSCFSCTNPAAQRTPERQRFWNDLRQKLQTRASDANIGQLKTAKLPRLGPVGSAPTQVVFLDFDTGVDGDVDYTPQLRSDIQDDLEQRFTGFDVTFTQQIPTGDFSTVFFNSGGIGGASEDLDFRNLNRNDNASLNLSGGFSTVTSNATLAAHELGHLLGLRHRDMFGPIGAGVLSGFGPFFNPSFTGPMDAFTEAQDHIMATPAFGIPVEALFDPAWFSERSSITLVVGQSAQTTIEQAGNDSIATAQPLTLQTLVAPNTIIAGQNAGTGDFVASVAVAEGQLDALTDSDFYRVEGNTGELFNLAIISGVTNRFANDFINPTVSVFDASGALLDYYGSDAVNNDEFESTDSVIFDLILQQDGPIFIKVDASAISGAGLYELFVYRFDGNGIIGDTNFDGTVDLLDVDAFVQAILSGEFLAPADINNDGVVDLLDVNLFVALLLGN